MEYVTLNNGVKMPQLGYGVYQVDPKECERCVLDAISSGYRLIDTAQAYHNEEGVGNAVKKCGVPREDLFIVTKIWICNAGEEKAYESILESLRKLQMDYMKKDVCQIMSWGPFAEGKNDFFTNPTLKSVGEAHGKSVAQVALRYLLQRGVVVIPKSTHRERMEQNIDVFDFTLNDAEMQRIADLDMKHSLFFSHYEPAMVEQFMVWEHNV